MTLRIDPRTPPEVDWPVTVRVPRDGGGVDKHTITVRYRVIDTNSLHERLRGADLNDPAATRALLAEHVLAWDGIEDIDGNPLAFTPDTLRALLGLPFFAKALTYGLMAASAGAPEKN